MTKLSILVVVSALLLAHLVADAKGGNFFPLLRKNKKGKRQRGNGGGGGGGGRKNNGGGGGRCDMAPTGPLDGDDAAELMFMREEEKMARDVYTVLSSQYGSLVTTFGNIASSEQKHMNSMKQMLDVYGVEDPVKSNDVGAFTDTSLGETYQKLATQGKNSLLDGLFVGALIEETDILDLRLAIDETEEELLACVYGNLLKASYNHLNAFVRQIQRQGGSYSPTLLEDDDASSILGN